MGKPAFLMLRKMTNLLSGLGLSQSRAVVAVHRFLFRILKPNGVITPAKLVLIEHQGNKMYIDSSDTVLLPAIQKGSFEEYETVLFKNMVKPGMTVIDIGANIGYYTLLAAKAVGKKGRVYSFEPEPNNYNLLKKNVEINGYKNVILVQKALSSKRGKCKLFIHEKNLGQHSICEDNVPERYKANFVEVETIGLDDYFQNFAKNQHVDVIKLDVEGAEGLVIAGADRILKCNNLKVLMEFWQLGLKNVGADPLKLLDRVREYGFNINLIDEKNKRLRPVDASELRDVAEVNLFMEK